MKTLDRLLFIQGGECFFCKKPLAKTDASIEHLVASANGGTNGEDNCVACCKTLNALLGSKSLKEKIEVVLRQKGTFKCPGDFAQTNAPSVPSSQQASASKASAATPKAAAPASSRPASPSPRPPEIIAKQSNAATTTAVRCPTCHHQVAATPGQIDFRCAHCNGAFRY